MPTTPKVLNQHYDYIPPGAVFVGRPSRFGNPFKFPPYYEGQDRATKRVIRDSVIRQYREYVLARPWLVQAIKHELKGKNLVCFCAPLPCHADVLLEIANSEV